MLSESLLSRLRVHFCRGLLRYKQSFNCLFFFGDNPPRDLQMFRNAHHTLQNSLLVSCKVLVGSCDSMSNILLGIGTGERFLKDKNLKAHNSAD